MASLWENASLNTLISSVYNTQCKKTNILVWHRLDARPAISYSVTFSIRKLKIAIVSSILIHVLQKADMQMKCGFLVPTFSFWKFLISAWSLRYCRNLTFWKYSAEYWLNLICSRPKLCACVQCNPKVALIYWTSSPSFCQSNQF